MEARKEVEAERGKTRKERGRVCAFREGKNVTFAECFTLFILSLYFWAYRQGHCHLFTKSATPISPSIRKGEWCDTFSNCQISGFLWSKSASN